MLTRLATGLPTGFRAASGTAEERLARIEHEYVRLIEALASDREQLNREGSLDIADASIAATKGIKFPATFSDQTDANTLDDYEERDWTPALSFATPGNVSVTYSVQRAVATKIGRLVVADFSITTSAFTHTTASGSVVITGLPFTPITSVNYLVPGSLMWQGITKAGYSQVSPYLQSSTPTIFLSASGSGVSTDDVDAADMRTGGSVTLRGCIAFVT